MRPVWWCGMPTLLRRGPRHLVTESRWRQMAGRSAALIEMPYPDASLFFHLFFFPPQPLFLFLFFQLGRYRFAMRPTKRSGQPHPHGKRGLDVLDVDCGVRWYLGVYIYFVPVQVISVGLSRQSIHRCISWICLRASKASDKPHVDMQPLNGAAP